MSIKPACPLPLARRTARLAARVLPPAPRWRSTHRPRDPCRRSRPDRSVRVLRAWSPARLETNSAFSSAWSRYSSAPSRSTRMTYLASYIRPHREDPGRCRFAEDLDQRQGDFRFEGQHTTIKSRSASREPARPSAIVATSTWWWPDRSPRAPGGPRHAGLLVADNECPHHGTSFFETAIRCLVRSGSGGWSFRHLALRAGNQDRPASEPRSVRICKKRVGSTGIWAPQWALPPRPSAAGRDGAASRSSWPAGWPRRGHRCAFAEGQVQESLVHPEVQSGRLIERHQQGHALEVMSTGLLSSGASICFETARICTFCSKVIVMPPPDASSLPICAAVSRTST